MKGEKAGYFAKHRYLYYHYGQPSICENLSCEKRSKVFEWCLKGGRSYSHNREDYLRLCRSCHRKYDLTEEKREKVIRNLWWKKGMKNPGVPNFTKGYTPWNKGKKCPYLIGNTHGFKKGYIPWNKKNENTKTNLREATEEV